MSDFVIAVHNYEELELPKSFLLQAWCSHDCRDKGFLQLWSWQLLRAVQHAIGIKANLSKEETNLRYGFCRWTVPAFEIIPQSFPEEKWSVWTGPTVMFWFFFIFSVYLWIVLIEVSGDHCLLLIHVAVILLLIAIASCLFSCLWEYGLTHFFKSIFQGKVLRADCFRCLKGAVSRQSDTVLRLLSVFAWRGGRSNRQGLKSVLLEHGSGQLSVTTLSLHFLICTCTGPGDSQ